MVKLLVIGCLVSCCFFISVGTLVFVPFLFTILLFSFALINVPFRNLNRELFKMLILMNIPFLISFLISFPINVFTTDVLQYYLIEPYGRVFNIIMFTTIVLYLDLLIRSYDSFYTKKNIIIFYYISCLIFVLSIFWHFLDIYLGFPIKFPLETRNYIHSTGGGDIGFESRLTGMASEPSYSAGFIVDFIILSFYVFKSKSIKLVLVILTLILAFFTLSPAVYSTLGGVILTFLIYKYGVSRLVSVIIPLVVGISVYFNISNNSGLDYILKRFVNVDDSERMRHIFNTLYIYFTDSNWFNILFGYGLKSFALISESPAYDFKDMYVTSNNIFIDILFEGGILSVVGLIVFLVWILKKILNMPKSLNKIVALLMFINIVVTSFIKADYASLRFFIVFFIIYLLSVDNQSYILKNTNGD